ncbi:hypothetical protein EHQ12_06145 [Leptospira gomenensis]|uniref:Uncharacterized protein n=1 Tax=Leptospira gomenensis TaxID=2484974 RepID=A0A5F1YK15_9LEPT|nr:hypothetical protein EHQ17_08095 [Leptospira gomenensis]TGK41152.1 hypothetical protein EHQ12_06145 [Leptospira gomenensis]TGK42092.1 hypothetical protein EHQ07_15025 [Leptospira gomenensis]TGK56354.1 hypothetical protein EHQ13_16095 [Leptospira gomenensis]
MGNEKRQNRIRFWGILTGLALIFLSNSIQAEQESENRENGLNKRNFELLLKRQTYQWTPYDYTSYTERPWTETSMKTDSVKQNQKVIVPFVFRYDHPERKFRIEISAYEIELANANTIVTQSGTAGYETRRQYFNPMIRSEAEFNLFRIVEATESWKLFFGLGIRNINKYKYGYFLREGAYQEYFYTYGPQAVFRGDYRISERFFLSFALDLFYTQGNRFYKPTTTTFDSIVVSSGSSGVRGIYRGSEIDVSVAYQISEALKFYLGYSYIDSYFSYYGFNQTDLSFGNSQNSPFQTETNEVSRIDNILRISHPIRSGNFDRLHGLYLGLSVNF